jgi:hypothetical protein
MADEEDLRRAILQLGEREGMTPQRLEDSELLGLMQNTPPGWTAAERSAALGRLVTEVVNELGNINLRSAAQVALNLGASVATGSAAVRWRAFSAAKGNSERTARNWWYDAATALARTLPERVAEINQAGDWPKYRVHGISGRPAKNLPPYRFARIDSSYWLRGRVGVRSVSSRRLVAVEDGVDRVRAVGRYYADSRPGAATIRALMNCRVADTRGHGRGATVADLELSMSLDRDEETFFSYETDFASDRECEPVVTHEVTAASVGLFVARVQFDPAELPDLCWYFAARTNVEALLEPETEETERLLDVNRLGYVEHRFHDCEYGVTYGIGWRWRSNDI